MIGETLKETLERMSPSQIVKIGSGNGYFYIGTVEDYLESSKEYDSQSVVHLEEYKRRLESAKKRLSSLAVLSKVYGCNPDSDAAKKYRQWVRIARANITFLENAVKSGKPFSKRNVLDIYESCMVYDEGTICVIVEGVERGKFWTIDETRGLPAFKIGA